MMRNWLASFGHLIELKNREKKRCVTLILKFLNTPPPETKTSDKNNLPFVLRFIIDLRWNSIYIYVDYVVRARWRRRDGGELNRWRKRNSGVGEQRTRKSPRLLSRINSFVLSFTHTRSETTHVSTSRYHVAERNNAWLVYRHTLLTAVVGLGC